MVSKSVTKVFYIKELVKLECKDKCLGSSFYDYVVILWGFSSWKQAVFSRQCPIRLDNYILINKAIYSKLPTAYCLLPTKKLKK